MFCDENNENFDPPIELFVWNNNCEIICIALFIYHFYTFSLFLSVCRLSFHRVREQLSSFLALCPLASRPLPRFPKFVSLIPLSSTPRPFCTDGKF